MHLEGASLLPTVIGRKKQRWDLERKSMGPEQKLNIMQSPEVKAPWAW